MSRAGWSSTSSMLTFSLSSMPLASPGSLTLAVQPRPYQRQQLLGVHRLGDVVRSPRFQALLAVALHGLGGEGDDRQQPELMLAADAAHGLVAVHFRHHDRSEEHTSELQSPCNL